MLASVSVLSDNSQFYKGRAVASTSIVYHGRPQLFLVRYFNVEIFANVDSRARFQVWGFGAALVTAVAQTRYSVFYWAAFH
jgi:hypothetical protein